MIQSHQKPRKDKKENERAFDNFMEGGGEMGSLMRACNWKEHPLGEPDQWPDSLKTNIRLLLNSGFPMFIWWSADFYMFHNDAYLPALGKKHPAALGASARQMWAEIWDQLGVVAEKILKDGQQFYAENLPVLMDRKGFLEETYWTFSYSPAFDDAGNVAGIFCACFEVTGTILGQRRLSTIKEISDAMAYIDSQSQACETACQKLKEDKEDLPFSLVYLFSGDCQEVQLMGSTGNLPPGAAPAVIPVQDREAVWPVATVLRTRQSQLLQLNAPIPAIAPYSQTTVMVKQAVVHPIFKPGQDIIVGFFVAGLSPWLEYDTEYRNFHELLAGQVGTSINSVQARQEIAQQKEYLREVFEQAPVGITILHGPAHVALLANKEMCELWGRRQEEVLGKPILEVIPEFRNQHVHQLLDMVYTTGLPYANSEMPVQIERNGKLETDYFSLVYHPKRDSHGVITGVIAIAISSSEQVEARQAIEAMNKELLATNYDLDNFVYAASHDLKAPISNIEGLVDALLEYLPPHIRQDETVQKLDFHIRSSVERFQRAVTDLTQVARLQREAEEDVAVVDLADVLADARLDFESVITATGAQLITSFAPGSSVRFSAKNVRSIVYNLLSNALKYRSPDRPPVVHISTTHTFDYLVVKVADNGLGVDLSKKEQMFTLFKRLHDHVEGTGVGLYIVKKIVENAGGKIEVESEEGKGTTFRVYLRH